MNGEEIRAVRRFPESRQCCTASNQVPLLFFSPLLSSLSSFQQCDYDEVNKNIRSAGVRPMTDEASERRAGREGGRRGRGERRAGV